MPTEFATPDQAALENARRIVEADNALRRQTAQAARKALNKQGYSTLGGTLQVGYDNKVETLTSAVKIGAYFGVIAGGAMVIGHAVALCMGAGNKD